MERPPQSAAVPPGTRDSASIGSGSGRRRKKPGRTLDVDYRFGFTSEGNLKGKLELGYLLPDDSKKTLAQLLGCSPTAIVTKPGASSHTHPVLAALRLVAEERALQSLAGLKIIDIGGNYSRHVAANRANIHCCCPVTSARDLSQHASWDARVAKLGTTVLEECRVLDSGVTKCAHPVQQCVAAADGYLAVDSIYYLGVHVFEKELLSRVKAAAIVAHFPEARNGPFRFAEATVEVAEGQMTMTVPVSNNDVVRYVHAYVGPLTDCEVSVGAAKYYRSVISRFGQYHVVAYRRLATPFGDIVTIADPSASVSIARESCSRSQVDYRHPGFDFGDSPKYAVSDLAEIKVVLFRNGVRLREHLGLLPVATAISAGLREDRRSLPSTRLRARELYDTSMRKYNHLPTDYYRFREGSVILGMFLGYEQMLRTKMDLEGLEHYSCWDRLLSILRGYKHSGLGPLGETMSRPDGAVFEFDLGHLAELELRAMGPERPFHDASLSGLVALLIVILLAGWAISRSRQ